MKNNTNIYDIDGEIIRQAGDNTHFTPQQIKQLIDKYNKKIKECEDEEKRKVYEIYVRNLTTSLIEEYKRMSPEKLAEILKSEQPEQDKLEDQVKQAIEDLKNEVEEEPKETVMDEYVDFTEEPA